MSSFKDQVQNDLVVFINPDEFGESHNIDGVEIDIVPDEDTVNERKYGHAEGTYLSKRGFFVRKEVLGYRPVERQGLTFDGDYFTVASVSENAGILRIEIEANES